MQTETHFETELKVRIIEGRINRIHEYCRHAYHVYILWFAAYNTLNWTALGLLVLPYFQSATYVVKGPLLAVLWSLLIQNVISVYATFRFRELLLRKVRSCEHQEKELARLVGLEAPDRNAVRDETSGVYWMQKDLLLFKGIALFFVALLLAVLTAHATATFFGWWLASP